MRRARESGVMRLYKMFEHVPEGEEGQASRQRAETVAPATIQSMSGGPEERKNVRAGLQSPAKDGLSRTDE